MYPCGDNIVTIWRQECTHDIWEPDHNSNNWANSVATVYQSTDDGFGIAWLREPEKPRWLEGTRHT